jgi:hypothetical protein
MPRCTALVIVLLLASPAAGQDAARASAPATILETIHDLHRACRDASLPGTRELYAIDLPPGAFGFEPYAHEEDLLPIDTRRNLLALGGRASLLPSFLETIGFTLSAAHARDLVDAARESTLRIGFFLGFDEPERTHCLIRPAVGVTTVRMDVAFAELLGSRGETLAREDGDRLTAWIDDVEHERVEGSGPRGAIGQASFDPALGDSERHKRALDAASRGAVGRAIGRCHADGVARGAQPSGHVAVRLSVDGATGRVRASEVELSTLGDDPEAECITRALATIAFPPGPPGTLGVSVPIRLAAD